MIAPRPERINISTLHERAGTLCLVHMYLGGDPLGGRVCTSPNFLHFGIWFTKLERETISPHLDFNIVPKLMGIERASHHHIPSPAHQRGCVSLRPLLGHLLPSVLTCPLMSIAPDPAGSLVFSLWMWAAGGGHCFIPWLTLVTAPQPRESLMCCIFTSGEGHLVA